MLVELEDRGADYVSATKVQVSTIDELKELGKEILANEKPYKGLIIDTITKLETMTLPLAAKMYKATPMGVNWTGTDVRTLPSGSGYLYVRKAFTQVMNYLTTLADNIIFVGHLTSKMINNNGEEFESKALDLAGKLSSMVCGEVDAVAYCYRKDNETRLNFNSSEEVVSGGRCKHLKGANIIIAESDESGKIKTFWERVFLPNK